MPPPICGEYCVLFVGIGVEAEADAGDRRGQVRELPAVERQVLDAADVDDAADRRGGRLDERRAAALP